MNSKQRLRARSILILVGIAAAVIIASLYSAEIIHGSSYAAKAQAQYAKPAATLFDRGTIYFSGRDGIDTAAATVAQGYLVYTNPKQVTDASGDFEALSHYLTSLDKATFIAKAGKPADPYEELAHHVDEASAQSIQRLGLPGIYAVPEAWRSYPGGVLASHELGLVGEDASSSEVIGRYGLERSYDPTLSRSGTGSSADVFAELFSGLKDSVFGSGSAHSGDIITTIEPTVQAYLEKVLAETQNAWHPDEIGGIVMDPSTGEIVAMSSLPTFNPNDTSTVKDASVFSNPLVEHVYEMGSIMKPLTMATALDTGAETPDSTYDDVGCMTIDKKKICNFDGRARGVIPMQQILSQSLNIGAATIALKVGSTTMDRYFTDFGLASTTGIDLPNEATGITSNLKAGTDIDVATEAYGQSIAISPVAMARALSVLANGGYLVTPHLVKEIDYTDGSKQVIAPVKTQTLLSVQTVQEVDHMLSVVADDALALGKLKMDHYTFAAKTGTAEIADPVNGGYYPDRYLHSFFGFFPAYNARFIVFLYQVYPKGAEYASETLTDPYNDLMQFLINYYNIPPDR